MNIKNTLVLISIIYLYIIFNIYLNINNVCKKDELCYVEYKGKKIFYYEEMTRSHILYILRFTFMYYLFCGSIFIFVYHSVRIIYRFYLIFIA